MGFELIVILAGVGFSALLLIGILMLIARFYRKVDQGQALIVNTMKAEPLVTFTGAVVWPIIHRAEVMDISVKTIVIDRRGKEGLICADNIRADIKVNFFVRVNKTADHVLQVAQAIGCNRASDQATLEELFNAKFSEALKTVGKQMNFEDLYQKRNKFKDDIIEVIGRDLNGYVLDDAAIDYLEQTPIEHLDKDNILDAHGIRKITEITAAQNVATNEFKQSERKAIKKQNVEAEEAVMALDRQQAEAQAKQHREIAVIQAREQAEMERVQAEEGTRAGLAKLKQEEELAIQEQNKTRQVEVAGWNRQRVVAVEGERVEKERQLEVLTREREVELQRIAKEKALEIERKAIADVIRARIAVDKTVAEEEERIKDLRVVAESKRLKESTIIHAEAQAGELLVKELKAAEAAEEVAKHEARRRLTLAEAELESADRVARAKIRTAEGHMAETAAPGLAEARVKEADALAVEKLGLAEARVTVEKMAAMASGEEKQGLARVKVREAEAAAIQKQGAAEAQVVREKMAAEAVGEEQKGLATARVKEADAAAQEKLGLAAATSIREKLLAEASGIAEKGNAMKALDVAGREHEEYRLQLDNQRVIALEAIRVRQHLAEAQAEVMGKAFANAKIQIVGGDGAFFDKFSRAVSIGASLDGMVESSTSVQTILKDYLDGRASLPQDIKDVLSRPALSASDVSNLSISALLGKLMVGADAGVQTKLRKLAEQAKALGLE
ncbi:MAG: hypothetical protein IT379_26510 [Deltaproteobacteria bacterium]|nr:hypothetical protein [Deltaproteobacteria bacterium]